MNVVLLILLYIKIITEIAYTMRNILFPKDENKTKL